MKKTLLISMLFLPFAALAQIHSSFNKNAPSGDIPAQPGALCECPPTIYPWIESMDLLTISQGATEDLTITGYYFDETSSVSSAGFTVNTILLESPNSLKVNVTAINAQASYDLIVSNFCAYDTLFSAFSITP